MRLRRRKSTPPDPEPTRQRERAALASQSRPIGDYLRPAGRILFWAVLLIVFVRGVSAIVSTDTSPERVTALERRVQAVEARDSSWPDAAADTFALQFARTYLSYAAGDDSDAHNAAVARFYGPGVADSSATEQEIPAKGVSQTFLDGSIARVSTTDNDHAAITVAAYVEQRAPRGGKRRGTTTTRETIYLTVPVGRDAAGRVAVFAAPALAPPVPLGRPTVPGTTSVRDPGGREITDVTRRFLAAYLAGKPSGDLAYYLATNATVDQFNGKYEISSGVPDVRQLGDDTGNTRRVVAVVGARDTLTGTTYTLSYQLSLIRRDRWQIRSMVGNPQEGS